MDKENQDIIEKLKSLEKEAKENLAGWQRAKADFLNYKKEREEKEKEIQDAATIKLVSSILSVIDGFELAEQHIPENLKRNQWVNGIFFIKNKLAHLLGDLGLDAIKTVGEKFNPQYHEAVEEVESDKESGTIVEEAQKGYKIQDKIIRPAKVKVAK